MSELKVLLCPSFIYWWRLLCRGRRRLCPTKKGGDVSELLDRASNDENTNHWYINFTSAYEFNFYYQLPPREVAVGGYWGFKWEEGMNVRLRTYLREKKTEKEINI